MTSPTLDTEAALVLRSLIEAAELPLVQAFRDAGTRFRPFWPPDEAEALAAHARPLTATMVRLFLAGGEVDADAVRAAFGTEITDLLVESGRLVATGAALRSPHLLVDALNRQVLAAAPPGHPAFVVDRAPYCGPESLWFARILDARGPYGSALDLCTGTGLMAMLPRAQTVLAVDLDPQAVSLARFNLAMNQAEHVELREGDLFGPAEGTRFDLVTANPPFLPAAPNGRMPPCGNGGRRGDEVLRRILWGVHAHLTDGGEALVYAEGFGDQDGPAILRDLRDDCPSPHHDYTGLVVSSRGAEQAIFHLWRMWSAVGVPEAEGMRYWREFAGTLPVSHYHSVLWRVTPGSGRVAVRTPGVG